MDRSLRCAVALVLGVGLGARACGAAKEPGLVKLPELRLNLKTKTIEFDGTFLVADYPLELLVCRGAMRDYESIVTTACKPSTLHTALLALGLKPRLRHKKDIGRVLREGDPVELKLRFERDGKAVTIRPCEFMWDVNAKRHVGPLPWVFYGSFLYPSPDDEKKKLYLGDVESWLIGLLGNLPSVIDLAPAAGLKYGMLEIDRKAVPPKGTKVTVIIRPAPPKKGPPARPRS